MDDDRLQWLLANPGARLKIDIEASSVSFPTGDTVTYPIDAFARYCLLEGIDQLGYLRKHMESIEAFEERRSWKP